MMKSKRACIAALAAAILIPIGVAHADGFSVLYTFQGSPDGAFPQTALIRDRSGNLYGTTAAGGNSGCGDVGCGVVYKLAPDNTETVLYTFTGGTDGSYPWGDINLNPAGNLYGTARYGGLNCGGFGQSCGTVFELAQNGAFNVLYFFGTSGGITDGEQPTGLLKGARGYHYGTTQIVGEYNCGTAYKVSKTGTESTLYNFDTSTGCGPAASPIADSAGNLYGTTSSGGSSNCGTIWKLTPDGSETVLYSFTCGSDGEYPTNSGLVMDPQGNFYGVATHGGNSGCVYFGYIYGCGTIFKLASDGTFTVLYTFSGGADGGWPESTLVWGSKGHLYGETMTGGDTNCTQNSGNGCGTVFELNNNGNETTLHAFTGGTDGAFPNGGLLFNKTGYVYGVALEGGNSSLCSGTGCGTIFKVQQFP